MSVWQNCALQKNSLRQQQRVRKRNSVFPITSLSIPGIWKKKHHSLRSTAALVNNPSTGATSESPAWSSTWWVPCQIRTEGVVERGKNEMRAGRRKGGEGRVYPSLLSYDHWSTTYCTLPDQGTCVTIFFHFCCQSLKSISVASGERPQLLMTVQSSGLKQSWKNQKKRIKKIFQY